MSGINSEHKIFLKVLTPVHIGGAQEKHLQEGIDYLQLHNGETLRLNWKKIYKRFEPDAIANAVINGSMKNLLDNELEEVTTRMKQAFGTTGEIKACIRDGLGQAFIPGSSIKGAFKSWLYTAIERNLQKKEAKNLLGVFETDLFRFVAPADCYLNNGPELYPTKIFNLHRQGSSWKGGWKHTPRIGTNQDFDNRSFVTDYECFSPDTTGSFSMKIRHTLTAIVVNKLFEHSLQARKSYDLFYQHDPLLFLMHHVNQEVTKHLKREIKFFNNYKEAKYTDEIIEFHKNLLHVAEDLKEGQCLLRLSAGSGFHGISGDHQFEDHTNTGIWTKDDAKKYKLSFKQQERYVGRYIKFKSRKIAFTPNYMYPMGFVLLSTKPFDASQPNETVNRQEEKVIVLQEKPVSAPVSKPALNPRFTNASNVKVGDIIYAEIIELGKPFHKVKLLLDNYPFESVSDLSGTKGYQLTLSQIVKCKLQQPSKSGEFKMVSYVAE